MYLESESTDNPILSNKVTLKLNLLLISIMQEFQSVSSFTDSIENLGFLISLIITQDQSYFENDED